MHFSSKIKKYYDGMNVYEHLLEDETAIHIPFALSFTVTIRTINEQLKMFLEDLDHKECQEIPDIDFDQMTDIRNIMSPKLKRDMAALDQMTIREHLEALFGEHLDKKPSGIHEFIYDNTLLMTEMLEEAHKKLGFADPEMFGKYLCRHISEGNWNDVKAAYRKWRGKQSDVIMELLLEKQEQELNRYLEKGIMCFAQSPSNQKMKKSDYGYHIDMLDCEFEDTEEYKKTYTKFMDFATRHEGVLAIDYKKYGKYIFVNYDQFSEGQKVAVFELCVMLALIREDMAQLEGFSRICRSALPLGSSKNSASSDSESEIRRCIALLMEELYGDEPLFSQQSHWQAVYRILVDKGFCRDSDFDGFDTFIRRVMPDAVNKPYKKDSVKQISQTDFAQSFERWKYDFAVSGRRKTFERMMAVATRFKAILEENGL